MDKLKKENKALKEEIKNAVNVVKIMSKTEDLNLDLQMKQNEKIEALEFVLKEEKETITHIQEENDKQKNTLKVEIAKLKEYIDKLEEQEELKSIGKDDENGNYQDIIEDLENANKELQGEIKTSNDINIKLKDDNVKLIEEIESMKSVIDMSDEEYEGELKDKEAIVNYLTDELDKFKKLFDESKKENEKAKDIKGIIVNEDKTIITINGVEITIGGKFKPTGYDGVLTLSQIYIGKTGKYSLRTEEGRTIRIGNSFITGKFKIFKKE